MSCLEAGRSRRGGSRVEARLSLCLVETSLKYSLQVFDGSGKTRGEGRQGFLPPKDPEKKIVYHQRSMGRQWEGSRPELEPHAAVSIPF